MQLIEMQNDIQWNKNGPTAIVDHGCNPGLVSHFLKRALVDMAQYVLRNECEKSISAEHRLQLEDALSTKNYPHLAYVLGIKTIHISERDTQLTSDPKKVNEFVNTWSIEGLCEEGMAPAEMGWGTHERNIPASMLFHDSNNGPCNQVCLIDKGMNTWVRSWVPSGEIIGMVIRHGEAYSISKFLTVHAEDENNNAVVYRPTVHYAYLPSDSTINSLVEFRMHNYRRQPHLRILNDEITEGTDEVGVLLLGGDYVRAWWAGSVLDIDEARRLIPGQNATTVQVAISVVAALLYCMKHPNESLCLPDDIDVDEILDMCIPYLGQWVSKPADWPSMVEGKTEEEWQFTSFLIVP